MSDFNFIKTVEEFKEAILELNGSNKTIEHAWNSSNGNDTEKKTAVDQAFREIVSTKLQENQKTLQNGSTMEISNGSGKSEQIVVFENLVNQLLSHGKEKKCTIHLPILLMSDIFDSFTLAECEQFFTFVEDNVHTWTTEPFFTPGKNHLLRMCNDILRRLSKSLNTIFCGRIQLFLARLFPLEEKSALNIMSNFHTENLTVYKKSVEEFNLEESLIDDPDADEGEVIEPTNPIDFNLYVRFWRLQDFFRLPTQCFTPQGWKTFKIYVSEILKIFENHKIEFNEKKRKGNESDDVTLSDIIHSGKKDYFPKYLTNEKLLNLQINDSNFRRYFLVQILILCQYLTGEVKFKGPTQQLADKQISWVSELVDKVYSVMIDTPPKGKEFASVVKHVLSREENWINWKNDSCPSFAKDSQPLVVKPVIKEVTRGKKRARVIKRSVGEEFLNSNKKKINLGTAELTRLWNLSPDNMESCKIETRLKFLPSLETFFEEAVEQADPEAGIEEEYKVVNDPNFQWRALRLLARRSHHFFTPSATPFKALPAYLTSVIEQLKKEFNRQSEDGLGKVEVKQEPTDS